MMLWRLGARAQASMVLDPKSWNILSPASEELPVILLMLRQYSVVELGLSLTVFYLLQRTADGTVLRPCPPALLPWPDT